MDSLVMSARDLSFMLHEWLDAESLAVRERYSEHSVDTFDAIIDVARLLAENDFLPHNRLSDLQEPELVDGAVRIIPEVRKALERYAASGLFGSTMDASLGGFQLPHVIQRAAFLWLQAANNSTAAYPLLSMANAHTLVAHADQELIDRFVPPMVEGRWFGTMCLSEPEIGSSLGDLTTTATRQDDGTYRLRGTKMWISGGDHEMAENIIHLVLARTGAADSGVRGVSLFIVPKYLDQPEPRSRNDVVLVGLNHKMGYRGTVNTALAFGDGTHRPDGAVGYLIGQEGAGLRNMFHMMNEARIGVGAGAAALGYTAYLHAVDYARGRLQGRTLEGKAAAGPQVAIIKHPDVRRMLLASKAYAEGSVALVLYAARLLDDSETHPDLAQRADASLLLDVMTPVVKSWPSQWCLVANDHAIQVHGGSGYTRDYPVEQFYRDNRLNPIHEGTFGIQALDLLGRKVRAEGGRGLELLAQRMRLTAASAKGSLARFGRALDERADRLVDVTEKLWASGSSDAALGNAALYLEAVGHVIVAWMWLEQAIAADGSEGGFYDGKRAATRYFFDHELPRTEAQFALLESGDDLMLYLDDDIL